MNIMLIIWKNRGNMNNFGEIIKDIRKKNNLTQKELADKLYVTYQAVSKWENNKSIPDISILQNISKMFNIDLNYLTNTKKRNNTIYFILIIIFLMKEKYNSAMDIKMNIDKIEAAISLQQLVMILIYQEQLLIIKIKQQYLYLK